MISVILFFALFGIGMLINLIASIWFIVAAFRESVLWGLAILFLPLAGLVFLFLHWEDVRTPFLLNILAIILFIACFFILPHETANSFTCPASFPDTSTQTTDNNESSSFSLAKLKDSIQQTTAMNKAIEQTAGRGYTGKTLAEVEEELGPPKGVITTSGETHYYYSSLELISIDGQTVADEIHK